MQQPKERTSTARTSERRVRVVPRVEPEGELRCDLLETQEPPADDEPKHHSYGNVGRPPGSLLALSQLTRPSNNERELLDAYRTVLDRVGDIVLLEDMASERIVHSSSAAVRLLGYSAEELHSMSARMLHPDGHRHTHDSITSELTRKGFAHRPELLLVRKDGSPFWAELHAGTFSVAGDNRCAIVVRDISAHVEEGLALRHAHAELEAAHARMLHTNKLAALGQIAAGVAHEVNNPASYVLMNLDEVGAVLDRGAQAYRSLRSSLLAWLEGDDRARAEECLSAFPFQSLFRDGNDLIADCIDGVQRITSLVKDLRGFARIDQSDVELVAINDVIVTACKMVGPNIRQRAHLLTRLESERRIGADRRRLVQVFTNLLVNAAQALDEGHAEEQEIEVITKDEEDAVVVRVRDTGPGIRAELLERIFEPFFTTKNERGTGLGLSLCSDIVRQHSGSIGAFGTPRGGAVFEVRLPFETGLKPVEAPPSTDRPSNAPRKGARVLVIDDEPQLLRAYRRLLGRDHEVSVANGGAAGLALIEKDPAFDVVVCDLMMPDVDGVKIYRSLDRIAPHLKPRIVFSSGGAFTRRAEELLSSIPNPFLPKPADPGELLEIIEQVRHASRQSWDGLGKEAPVTENGACPETDGRQHD